MKMLAGEKLCGRKPRHMPIRMADASAGAASDEMSMTFVIE